MMPHDPHVKAVLCSIFICSTSIFVSDSISWHLPPWWWGESVLVLKHAKTTTGSASTFATSSANSGGKNLQYQLDSLLLCPIGVRWHSGRMTLGLGTKKSGRKTVPFRWDDSFIPYKHMQKYTTAVGPSFALSTNCLGMNSKGSSAEREKQRAEAQHNPAIPIL